MPHTCVETGWLPSICMENGFFERIACEFIPMESFFLLIQLLPNFRVTTAYHNERKRGVWIVDKTTVRSILQFS